MSDVQLYLFEFSRNKDEAARIAAQTAERAAPHHPPSSLTSKHELTPPQAWRAKSSSFSS